MTRKQVGGLALALALTAPVATADMVPLGDPTSGNSWYQTFSKFGSFDLFAARRTDDGEYCDPGQANFSSPDWAESFNNRSLSVAKGPRVSGVASWLMRFEGDIASPAEFDVVFFDGPVLKATYHFSYNGNAHASGWSSSVGTWNPGRPELDNPIMPAPGSILLGMIGLIAVGGISRRIL